MSRMGAGVTGLPQPGQAHKHPECSTESGLTAPQPGKLGQELESED